MDVLAYRLHVQQDEALAKRSQGNFDKAFVDLDNLASRDDARVTEKAMWKLLLKTADARYARMTLLQMLIKAHNHRCYTEQKRP